MRLTSALLLLMCISCGQIGLGPPEREIEKQYRRSNVTYNGLLEGKIRGSKRDWDNLIRQFDEFARDYPKSRFADDALYKTGLCYIQTHGLLEDSPKKAIKAFEYLIRRYPDSEFVDDARYWKAYAYSLEGDYEHAIEEYQQFARKYPQGHLHEEALHQIEECQARIGGQGKDRVAVIVPEGNDLRSPAVIPERTDEGRSIPLDQQTGAKVGPVAKEEDLASGDGVPEPPWDRLTDIPIPDHTVERRQEEPGMCSYVSDIRFHSAREFTRVVVDLSGPVSYEVGRLEDPDRLYLDLRTAAITPAKRTIQVNDKVIERIRSAQFDENTVRVVLDTGRIQSYNVFDLREPDRIVVDVYRSDVTPLKPSPADEEEPLPLVKQLRLKVKTIVIDPGHGGKDPGAVSEDGLQEKHVVLDIAKRLKELLESSGAYQVCLTRETDVFVPLHERTAFANQKGADVFISIHINSCRRPDARGIETYYLSLASDEEARLTAALENASAEKTIRDLSGLVRSILSDTKLKESRELARTVQSRLSQHTGTDDRGIKRAPFIVLIGAQAPSILVELGFMSNTQDERLLRSQNYRGKLARALMEAVENYVKTIDQAS